MGDFERKLASLGLTLPKTMNLHTGVIKKAKRIGDMVFVSGHVPRDGSGKLVLTGKVGKDISVKEGYEAAKLCALNCLAAIKVVAGSLDNVREIVRIRGFVNCEPSFYEQPQVVNGASELMVELLGDRGRHARTAIGCPALPLNAPVEIDMLVRVMVS